MTDHSDDLVVKYAQYAEDPWKFLTECVMTEDPEDLDHPVKPYPSHLEYLEALVRLWTANKKLAVPKSRRMTVSWTFIGLMLWDVLFHRGRKWACVSKKEDDSAELLKRAEFIFRNIPEDRIPRSLLPKLKNDRMTSAPPVLEFPDLRSSIQGFPQGADQLRQFGFSGIFGDECAFWEEAQKFYSGSRPTIQGGGRMCLVSSRAPGFFKKIVYDRIDWESDNFPELPPSRVRTIMPGVDIWKNPGNGFLVFELHYSANPVKRSPAFREEVRRSMPRRDFEMEYEKSWQTFEGLPVYGDFNSSLHLCRESRAPKLGLPLLLGFDFGRTPACIVSQLEDDTLNIYREFTSENKSIETFAPLVMNQLRILYPQYVDYNTEVICFVDPAGFDKRDTDERTCVSIMKDKGFLNIRKGAMLWKARESSVTNFLIRMTAQGACLQIQEGECPILVAGFRGGYKYPQGVVENEPNQLRPVKDVHSHPHDALQMITTGIKTFTPGVVIDLPAPQYGFQNYEHSSQLRSQYGRKVANTES